MALAAAIAILIHWLSIGVLSAAGFRLSGFIAPITPLFRGATLAPSASHEFSEHLSPFLAYLFVTTALGFGLGLFVSIGILHDISLVPARLLRWRRVAPLFRSRIAVQLFGNRLDRRIAETTQFRRLSSHRWIYDILDARSGNRLVIAYIMTNIVDDSRIVMYKGILVDVFLRPDGNISYILLEDCMRYYMMFKHGMLFTSKGRELFHSVSDPNRLIIDGKNISNALFQISAEWSPEKREAVSLLVRAKKSGVAR